MSISDPLSSGLFFRRRPRRPLTPSVTPPTSRPAPPLRLTPASRPSSLLSSLPPSTAPAASLRELVERNEQPLAVRAAAAALRAVQLEPNANDPLYESALNAARSVCQQAVETLREGSEVRRLFNEEGHGLDDNRYGESPHGEAPSSSFGLAHALLPHMPSLAHHDDATQDEGDEEGLHSMPRPDEFEASPFPSDLDSRTAHIHLATHSLTPHASVANPRREQDYVKGEETEEDSLVMPPTPTRTLRPRSSPHGVRAASLHTSLGKRKVVAKEKADTSRPCGTSATIAKKDGNASRKLRVRAVVVMKDGDTPRKPRGTTEAARMDDDRPRELRASTASAKRDDDAPRKLLASTTAAKKDVDTPRMLRSSAAAAKKDVDTPRKLRASNAAAKKDVDTPRMLRSSAATAKKDVDTPRKLRASNAAAKKNDNTPRKLRASAATAKKDDATLRKPHAPVVVVKKETDTLRKHRAPVVVVKEETDTPRRLRSSAVAVKRETDTPRERRSAAVTAKKGGDTQRGRRSSAPGPGQGTKPRKSRLSEVLKLQKALETAQWTNSRAVSQQTEVIVISDDEAPSQIAKNVALRRKSVTQSPTKPNRSATKSTIVVKVERRETDPPRVLRSGGKSATKKLVTRPRVQSKTVRKRSTPPRTNEEWIFEGEVEENEEEKAEEDREEEEEEQKKSEEGKEEYEEEEDEEDEEEKQEDEIEEDDEDKEERIKWKPGRLRVKRRRTEFANKIPEEGEEDEDEEEEKEWKEDEWTKEEGEEQEGELEELEERVEWKPGRLRVKRRRTEFANKVPEEGEEDDDEEEEKEWKEDEWTEEEGEEEEGEEEEGELEELEELQEEEEEEQELEELEEWEEEEEVEEKEPWEEEEDKDKLVEWKPKKLRMKRRRTEFVDEVPEGRNRVLFEKNEKTSPWKQSPAYQEDLGGVNEVEVLTKRKSQRRKSRPSLGDFSDEEEEVAERNGSKTRETKPQPLEGDLGDEEELDERNERESQRRRLRAHASVAAGKRASKMSRLRKSSAATESPPSTLTTVLTTRSHRNKKRESEPRGHRQGTPVALNPIRRSPRQSRHRSEANPAIGVVPLGAATLASGEAALDMPSTRRRKGRPKKNTAASNDVFTEVSGDWICSREESVRQDWKGNERTRKLHDIVVKNRGIDGQDLPVSDGENVMMAEQIPSTTTKSPSKRKRRRVQHIVEEDSEVDAPLEKATVRHVRDLARTDANAESPTNTRKKQRTHIQSVPVSGIEKGSTVEADEISPTDSPKQNTKKRKSRIVVTSPQLRTRSQGMEQGESSRARLNISGNQQKLVGDSDDEEWEADKLGTEEWDSIIRGWMLQGQVRSGGMNWVGLREMWDALRCPFGLGRNAAQIVPELAECRPTMSGTGNSAHETANKIGASDDEGTVSEQVSEGGALEERKQAGCQVG